MTDDRWRRLAESPLGDDPPSGRPSALVVVAAAAIVVIVIGFVVLRSDGEPSTTAAVATTTIEATTTTPAPTTTSLGTPGVPSPRVLYEAAFDRATSRLVIFGGTTLGLQGQAGDVVTETWAYDPADDEWLDLTAPLQPSGRIGHAMAGTDSDVIVLFGGASSGGPATCGVSGPCATNPQGDTWVFVAETGWTQQAPASSPSPRYGAAMAYDSESKVMVLFGGAVRSESSFVNDVLGDTWLYDVVEDRWSEVEPPLAPSPRGWARMAYSPDDDLVLLFGGGAPGGVDEVVWGYDTNANDWQPFTATGPSPRWAGVAAFDEDSGTLVLVGGHGPVVRSLGEAGTATEIRFLQDAWAFDPGADEWTSGDLLPGAAFWVDGGWDPASDRIYTLLPGRPDAPATIGAYDVDTDTWTWSDEAADS